MCPKSQLDDVQRKAVLGIQVPASYLSELSSPKRGRDPSYRDHDMHLFFLNFCATQASEFYTIKMNFLLHSQSMQILEVEVSLYMLSTGQASSICLSPKAWKFSVELSPPSWVTSKEREHGMWHESVQRSDLGMGPSVSSIYLQRPLGDEFCDVPRKQESMAAAMMGNSPRWNCTSRITNKPAPCYEFILIICICHYQA